MVSFIAVNVMTGSVDMLSVNTVGVVIVNVVTVSAVRLNGVEPMEIDKSDKHQLTTCCH
jgi:hypothetical protein